MNKMIKKILPLALFAGMLPAGLASCGQQNNDEPVDSQHIFSGEETGLNLVTNGKTDYRVVYPVNLSTEMQFAKDEFVRFFAEATGITLTAVSDANVGNYSENARYISFGENYFFQSANIAIDKEALKRDGVRIVTKGKSIFVVGGADIGTLYGAYDLLNMLFRFDAYSPNCYGIDKQVRDVPLLNYDVTDIPDLEFRMRRGIMNPSTAEQDDTMFAYRMRHLDGYGQKLLPIHLGNSKNNLWRVDHNSFIYFPLEEYQTTHSSFYSSDLTQLCFSAHGNQEEFELMTSLAAAKVEQSLEWYPAAEYPNYIGVEIGMNDTPYLCDCEHCKAIADENHGAISATIIRFLQSMGEKVNAWMELPGNELYKRPLQYMFLAYQAASKPPMRKGEDGTYIYKEEIVPHNGVHIVPYVASMGLDYGKPFYSSANDEGREYIEAWGKFYPGSWSWSYGGFFNDYISFYDLYSFYDDFHAFLAKNNYAFTFNQCHDDQKGADTGFFTLANYVLAKKAWNSSIPMKTLFDDFFANMYLEAEKPMKDMFNRYRRWFAEQTVDKGWTGSILSMSVSGNKKYWSVGLIRELLSYIDDAYEAIEVEKKNATLYRKLCDRIDTEFLAPAKVVIDCYADEFSTGEYNAIKARFKEICKRLSVKDIREFVSINSYLESL